ncbi:hypothetical protein [Streptomyces sp. TLI_146]|uniref:hypothetical protein n=1 Tax=Streptomyces sp. TLI_146 TaxID=1938858 RepID=UPI001180EC3C|nr:hypothetical protein [Streptomyces sp. TLI_146]
MPTPTDNPAGPAASCMRATPSLLAHGAKRHHPLPWTAIWNENPRPFAWTKTADEILTSLADYLAKVTPPGTKTT